MTRGTRSVPALAGMVLGALYPGLALAADGGTKIWFGSSAGGALSSIFPQARSVGLWLRKGWYVPVTYGAGSFVMPALIGFHPGYVPKVDGAAATHAAAPAK